MSILIHINGPLHFCREKTDPLDFLGLPVPRDSQDLVENWVHGGSEVLPEIPEFPAFLDRKEASAWMVRRVVQVHPGVLVLMELKESRAIPAQRVQRVFPETKDQPDCLVRTDSTELPVYLELMVIMENQVATEDEERG